MLFNAIATLGTENLKPVWDDLSTAQRSILTITYGNTKQIITPEQQFNNYFHGRSFVHFDYEQLKIKFLMILNDETSTFLLNQIKRATEYLNFLSDVDNWYSETTYTSDNKFNNQTTTNTDAKNIAKVANTDNNSNMSNDVIKGFLSQTMQKMKDDGIFIPANSMGLNVSDEENNSINVASGSGDSTSKTQTNNPSEDIIRLLKLEIAPLRNRFWMRFDCLFRD